VLFCLAVPGRNGAGDMLPAETAIRAWINGHPTLTGIGKPISNGAYNREQRSPASGCYAVVVSATASASDVVGEPCDDLAACQVVAQVYGGTIGTAETAAVALATEVGKLAGNPVRCGGSGYRILAADKLTGPVHVPLAPDAGEAYCFQVTAEFILAAL
jgi:hypothetical protein